MSQSMLIKGKLLIVKDLYLKMTSLYFILINYTLVMEQNLPSV